MIKSKANLFGNAVAVDSEWPIHVRLIENRQFIGANSLHSPWNGMVCAKPIELSTHRSAGNWFVPSRSGRRIINKILITGD